MKFMSKHFMSDGCNQLVLESKDWTKEQFAAFKKIFGVDDTDRIVITEYKIEAWSELEPNDADWIVAYDHLNMVIGEYAAAGTSAVFALIGHLLPLKKRYDTGERTRELYDEIMECE